MIEELRDIVGMIDDVYDFLRVEKEIDCIELIKIGNKLNDIVSKIENGGK